MKICIFCDRHVQDGNGGVVTPFVCQTCSGFNYPATVIEVPASEKETEPSER